MSGYTKLFSSILASTVWREPKHVRIVWITMLAMADKHGVVEAAVPGLADFARVSLDECNEALLRLTSPDPYSRTKEHDGRRIAEIDGGWHILNHGKYRAKMSAEDRREYNRIKQQESRARQQMSKNVKDVLTCEQNQHNAAPEAEAEAEGSTHTHTRSKRLHGIPTDVEAVISAGASLNPPKDEATCRGFWSYYEGQARTNENGETFWVTGGQNPTVVTNWKVKLSGWEEKQSGKSNGSKTDRGASESQKLYLAKSELERIEKSIADVQNGYDGHREYDEFDADKLRELKKRRKELKGVLGFKA